LEFVTLFALVSDARLVSKASLRNSRIVLALDVGQTQLFLLQLLARSNLTEETARLVAHTIRNRQPLGLVATRLVHSWSVFESKSWLAHVCHARFAANASVRLVRMSHTPDVSQLQVCSNELLLSSQRTDCASSDWFTLGNRFFAAPFGFGATRFELFSILLFVVLERIAFFAFIS